MHVFYVHTVETCVATEDDVLVVTSPGGKNMALYEVRKFVMCCCLFVTRADHNTTQKDGLPENRKSPQISIM